MSQRLGSIVVDLIANTVSFSDGMSKASQLAGNSSKQIQRSLLAISSVATAMAASVIGSLTAVIGEAENFAFTIQKSAAIVGTSSEMFSKLAYNAKLVGIPLDTVKGAMERLARTAGAAKSGNKEAGAAYAALGISLKDLNGPLKDSGDLTVAVAKKLDVYKDSTNKTNIEQKIFGRSGAELAPLLKQIATGFDTAAQQATLFGVVIGDKTAAQARQLHVSMVELESAALGFSLRLLSGVAPALQDVTGKILAFVTSANGMKTVEKVAGGIASSIEALGNAFSFVANHIGVVKGVLEGFIALRIAAPFITMIASAGSATGILAKLGTATLNVVGSFAGFSRVGTMFVPMIAGAWNTVAALGSLAASEGLAAASAYALELALTPLVLTLGSITAALGLLSVGLIAVVIHMKDTMTQAAAMSGGNVTWADHWTASVNQLIDRFRVLKLYADKWSGGLDKDDEETQKFVDKYGLLGKSIVQAVSDAASGRRMGSWNADKPKSAPTAETAKLDAPVIPKAASDKVDHLKLKMDELAGAAKVAHDALMNAGKGVDFERADAIAKEYTKTVIELSATLKAQGKVLTDADKSAILTSITTRINDDSQAKYRDTLKKSTDEIFAQVEAQNALNASLGAGAAAVRAAAIAANAAKDDAGKSDEWKQKNAVLRSTRDVTYGMQYDAANRGTDKSGLLNIQEQINAHVSLNKAILEGKDAREAANLANEQAAITKAFHARGNIDDDALNKELEANQKLFESKKQQSDLQRAASMNPAQIYQDEAKAIQDAADAARDAGNAISDMQIKAANKVAWDAYLASIDKTTLAVGDATQGVAVFFREMGRDTISAAQQIHDVLGGAFNSLNQTIEKLISGQKASFSQLFRSISEQIAKIGLQKAEQGVAKSITDRLGTGDPKKGPGSLLGGLLGGGKGANPTVTAIDKSNSILAQIAINTRASGGGMPGFGGGASGDNSGGSGIGIDGLPIGGFAGSMNGDAAGGLLTDFSKGIASFGGGFANGGDVMAGVPIDVGETGKERFVPQTNGRIIPNSQLGNGSQTIHIDARGSNDPAQVEASVHRAMRQYGPGLVAASAKQQHESKMRRPSRAA